MNACECLLSDLENELNIGDMGNPAWEKDSYQYVLDNLKKNLECESEKSLSEEDLACIHEIFHGDFSLSDAYIKVINYLKSKIPMESKDEPDTVDTIFSDYLTSDDLKKTCTDNCTIDSTTDIDPYAAFDTFEEAPINKDSELCPVGADAKCDVTCNNKIVEPSTEKATVKCVWCNQQKPIDQCKKEVDLGWLCNHCIETIESRNKELGFTTPLLEYQYRLGAHDFAKRTGANQYEIFSQRFHNLGYDEMNYPLLPIETASFSHESWVPFYSGVYMMGPSPEFFDDAVNYIEGQRSVVKSGWYNRNYDIVQVPKNHKNLGAWALFIEMDPDEFNDVQKKPATKKVSILA